MKKYLLTLACVFIVTIGFCQDQYFKSFIFINDGSKVEGFISNMYDAKAIKFRKTLKSEPIVYKPADIRGFVLSESIFETKIVKMLSYKYASSSFGALGEATTELTIDTSKGQTTDTVFCQKIISGIVNLYKLRYTDNSQYLFVEKNKIISEVPRQYYIAQMGNNAKTDVNAMALRQQATLNYTTYEYRTYLDTLALFCDNFQIKPFDYSEKKVTMTVASYNRKMGVANGGFVKRNIPNKVFFGGGIGTVAWKRDENFKYEPTIYSFAASGYLLKPLSGINRRASAKLGLNYFVYGNSRRSLTVLSASIGLRYAALSGFIRPYGGLSLAISQQFVNNKSYSTLVPSILEGGVMIPVKDFYITIGANLSPLKYSYNNAYKLLAWQVGIIF